MKYGATCEILKWTLYHSAMKIDSMWWRKIVSALGIVSCLFWGRITILSFIKGERRIWWKKSELVKFFFSSLECLIHTLPTENLRNVKHFHVVMNLSFHFPNRDHLRFVPWAYTGAHQECDENNKDHEHNYIHRFQCVNHDVTGAGHGFRRSVWYFWSALKIFVWSTKFLVWSTFEPSVKGYDLARLKGMDFVDFLSKKSIYVC
mgnify:CR=1 FL=1